MALAERRVKNPTTLTASVPTGDIYLGRAEANTSLQSVPGFPTSPAFPTPMCRAGERGRQRFRIRDASRA